MSNEGDPRDLGIDPENRSLARPDSSTEIEAVGRNRDLEAVGFSPLFPDRLKTLNDTLVILIPPKSYGFNMKVTPGAVNPVINFDRKVEMPFDIEIAGFETANARIRIYVKEVLSGNGVELVDIQNFTRQAFPDGELEFHAEPRVEFNDVRVRRRPGQKIPNDLYEESKDDRWIKDVDEATRKGTGRFLQGLLPTIDEDLYKVTQEELDRLTYPHEGAKVEITFYSKYDINPRKRRVSRRESMLAGVGRQLYDSFNINLRNVDRGTYDKILGFYADNTFGSADCLFRQLDFTGKAEDVERVIEEFSKLMQKTPDYKRHLREQLRQQKNP